MKDDSLDIHEEPAALSVDVSFKRIHRIMFPDRAVPKVPHSAPEGLPWNPHAPHIVELIRTRLREARGRVDDLEKMLEDAEHGS